MATIDSGAQFNFVAAANKTLTPGKVFVIISNTAATPINGTFANLPDGSTFTVGPNTFQVIYSSGDGRRFLVIETHEHAGGFKQP
jgi:hypothetical protein